MEDKIMPATVDEYILRCDAEIQPMLKKLRETIAKAAPEAGEKISWGMATFTLHGNLVHFAAEKKHIGFHPGPSGIEAFKEELAAYHVSKGTARFPYDEPVPFQLVEKIVKYRVKEQKEFAGEKAEGKKAEPVLRPRYPMPEDIEKALEDEKLREQYDARPPYQRNDYIGWINRAKRADTRDKRRNQMLDELRAGDSYMGMEYLVKR